MAKKEKTTKKAFAKKPVMSAEEKAAKRKERMEAIKNRPAGQRPNSKQLDVIAMEDGSSVRNYGQVVKNREGFLGVLVTSVVVDAKGSVIGTSVTFVPGNLTVKAKKGHGTFSTPEVKDKAEGGEDDYDEDEDED